MFKETYSAAANPDLIETDELHVLFAGESQTLPDHRLGPKIYDYFLLHFVEQGKGTFRTESASYELSEGDGFLILPDQLVSYASDVAEPWRYRWIAFTGVKAAELVKRVGFTPQQPVFRQGGNSPIPAMLSSVLQAFQTKKTAPICCRWGCFIKLWPKLKRRLAWPPRCRRANRAFSGS